MPYQPRPVEQHKDRDETALLVLSNRLNNIKLHKIILEPKYLKREGFINNRF